MVEKIIISPESIRGLGNIVSPKTGADFEEYNCTMEVSEDTVNGEDVTVYVLTPETTTISLVLSSSVDSCGIGDSVVLSVTVTEDSVPVSGASVSFKLGGTEIGTGTTNSSGVATYTYTTADVGSLNFTSVYAGHSSNSVSVVVSHDYSIAFSQSSYPASSGSATLELTLLDNSSPVSGATVAVTGSDSSVYSCITNSSGVGTVTVSNVSSETTFTATFGSVSDTCTVTVGPSYLFYDDCSSSSRLSEYGNYVSLFGTSGNGTITYNSTENAYSIAKTNNRDAFTGFKLPITATDKIKITCKVKLTSTSAYNQFGIGIQQSTSKYELIRIRGDKYFDGFKNSTNSVIGSNSNVASFNSAYYYLEISYDGSSRVARIYDDSMSLVKEWNISSVQSYTNPAFYLAINTNSTNSYVKEIKVESL